MSDLFSFSPLFFYNVQALVQNRQQLRADRQLLAYSQGSGFDYQKAVPTWLPAYFGGGIDDLLQVPYRLPGVGIPTASLLNPAPPSSQQSNAVTGFYAKFQAKTYTDMLDNDGNVTFSGALADINPNTLKLNAGTGQAVMAAVKSALMYAGSRHDLVNADESQAKMNSQQVINGEMVPTDRAFSVHGRDPTALDDARGKFREDLANILPWVNTGDVFNIMNFAYNPSYADTSNGRLTKNTFTGQRMNERKFLTSQLSRQDYFDAIAQHPWASQFPADRPRKANRKQMLVEAGASMISQARDLPYRPKLFNRNDVLSDAVEWANYAPYKKKAAHSIAKSRFADG